MQTPTQGIVRTSTGMGCPLITKEVVTEAVTALRVVVARPLTLKVRVTPRAAAGLTLKVVMLNVDVMLGVLQLVRPAVAGVAASRARTRTRRQFIDSNFFSDTKNTLVLGLLGRHNNIPPKKHLCSTFPVSS